MTVKRIFGSGPNQIARNKDLGSLAWQNKTGLNLQNTGTTSIVGGSPALPNASQINFVDAGSSNGYLTFSTTASGTVTERMRLDTSGNLGLGVTPSAWVTYKAFEIGSQGSFIYGNNGGSGYEIGFGQNAYYDGSWRYKRADKTTLHQQYGGAYYWYTAPSGTAGSAISFTQAMTLDAGGSLSIGTAGAGGTAADKVLAVEGTTSGQINLRYNGTSGAYLYSNASNTVLSSVQNLPLLFNTNNTERMRIDSSGNLLVAKTSINATVLGAEIRSTGQITSTMAATVNTTETLDVYSTGAAAYRFYVGMGGTVYATNTTISAISDQRFKENIRDLNVGLDAVMALKPRVFDWKEGKGKDIKNDRGFIAQEFEQVFPDLIDEWKDPAPEGEEPYKSVRQDLIPVLVKAIQELKAELDELKAKVN